MQSIHKGVIARNWSKMNSPQKQLTTKLSSCQSILICKWTYYWCSFKCFTRRTITDTPCGGLSTCQLSFCDADSSSPVRHKGELRSLELVILDLVSLWNWLHYSTWRSWQFKHLLGHIFCNELNYGEGWLDYLYIYSWHKMGHTVVFFSDQCKIFTLRIGNI